MNQKVGGWGKPKGKATSQGTTRAKVHSNGTTTHAHSEHPAGQQQISQLTLIIDNLIKNCYKMPPLLSSFISNSGLRTR